MTSYALPVTRENLIQPPGQKFAIGDRVLYSHPHAEPGSPPKEWLVEGSYLQLCRSHVSDHENLNHLSEYGLVDPETGNSFAWAGEEELTLVPGRLALNPASLSRAELIQDIRDMLDRGDDVPGWALEDLLNAVLQELDAGPS